MMKNSFNLEVSLSPSPIYPYEWTKTSVLTNIPVTRVSSHTLKKTLLYEGKVHSNLLHLLLSDGKNAIVLKLDKNGHIKARSFLKFSQELDVCEYAMNLKEKTLEVELTSQKVHYEKSLALDAEMKKYLVERIRKCKDENLSKYLYYLYFDDIKGYSRDKLLSSIIENSIDKNLKLYNFLLKT